MSHQTAPAAFCHRIRHLALNGLPHITLRQSDVLALLSTGDTDKEIAKSLSISTETVKEHIAALKRHFRVRSRTELGIIGYIAGAAVEGDTEMSAGTVLRVEFG